MGGDGGMGGRGGTGGSDGSAGGGRAGVTWRCVKWGRLFVRDCNQAVESSGNEIQLFGESAHSVNDDLL